MPVSIPSARTSQASLHPSSVPLTQAPSPAASEKQELPQVSLDAWNLWAQIRDSNPASSHTLTPLNGHKWEATGLSTLTLHSPTGKALPCNHSLEGYLLLKLAGAFTWIFWGCLVLFYYEKARINGKIVAAAWSQGLFVLVCSSIHLAKYFHLLMPAELFWMCNHQCNILWLLWNICEKCFY